MHKEYETTSQNSCYYAWNLNKMVPDIFTIAMAGKPGHLSYLHQVNEGGENGTAQHVVLRRLLPQQG